MNPFHTFPPCFPVIHSYIIIRSSAWPFPSGFPSEILYTSLSYVLYDHPSHPAWLDHHNNAFVYYTSYKAPHCAVFFSTFLLPSSSVQIFSSAPCYQTPSVCVHKDHVSGLNNGNASLKVFAGTY
jgi:hypothetical protein